jgi:ABC-type sugar transport system substrate-binding protein
MSIEETARAETRKRIGFLTSAFLPQDDDITAFEFFAVLTAEVVSYLQDKYEIVIRVPKLSTRNNVAREQGKLLETFLAAIELYDALIISPYSVDEIVRTFERVADGITLPPVLTIDQSLKSSRSSVAEKIERWSMEPFNREGGELAASSLDRYYRSISDRPSAPVFIVIRGTGSSPVRAESFVAEITKRIPACEVLDSKEEGEYTRDRGKRIIQGYLNTLNHATWRQVAGIFACSDELALGIYTRSSIKASRDTDIQTGNMWLRRH